jgi:hypothetical protein
VKDVELLRQLMTPIVTNLEHRDEYVRRHAAILVGRLSRGISQTRSSRPFRRRPTSAPFRRCSTRRTRRTRRRRRI